MDFKREKLTQSFINEALPLLEMHHKEIAHYGDIELKPDYEQYLRLDELDMVRVFTARSDHDHTLIGYAIFFIRPNMHYSDSLQAVQDILYINPKFRGKGYQLIRWCDQQLQKEGVQAVYHHVKASHDFGPLLKRMGYGLIDYVYGKRLDFEG